MATSQHVLRLEARGVLMTRSGPKGTKLVNVEEFLRAVEKRGPVSRDIDEPAPSPGKREMVLSEEQARNIAASADLREIDRDEKLGLLVWTKDVETAMVNCGEALNRGLGQLVSRAEDAVAAVHKDGVAGMRIFLREEVRRLREILAREMKLLSGSASKRPSKREPAVQD